MIVKFVIIGGGIFLSFWVIGLLQEKLYKGIYGADEEKFTYVMSLIFVTTSFHCLSSFAALKMMKTPVKDKVPVYYQYSIGGAFLLAMFCSQAALKWVSYPAQVLAKSAKPIPVLVLGVLIGKKNYHLARYAMAVLIVIGLVLFTYRDDKAAKSKVGFGVGELLLILSLLLDGILTSLEERVMSKVPINPVRFMFDINVAAVFYIGYAFVLSGEIFTFACFAQRHPIVILHLLIISFCSAAGQFFIFSCITEFGTLTCSIVTTARKFFTVLSSIVVFGHVLQWRQWLGIAFVFGGLALDIHYGKIKNRREAQR